METPRSIRTTAIAALVAVTTALTTVSPAFADVDTRDANSSASANETQPAGLNTADGSKLPEGTNKSEDELKAATGAVATKITQLWDGKYDKDGKLVDGVTPADVFAKYLSPAALRDNEAGALAALEDHYKAITNVLAMAAQNQADAMASVKYALDADDAAYTAWDKLVKDVKAPGLNAMAAEVNRLNRTNVPAIPLIGVVTPQSVLAFLRGVVAHRDNSWNIAADQSADNYVSRQYQKALLKLLTSKEYEGILKPYLEAQAPLAEAQTSDVISRQMFMDRSRAQVQVLRIIQAKYAIAIRLIQLYENDRLQANDSRETVSKAYMDVVKSDPFTEALEREYAQLVTADQNAIDLFDGWKADLGNGAPRPDAERRAYIDYRDSQAKQTYANIVADRVWQNELATAQLLDRQAFGKAADEKRAEENATKLAAAESELNKLNGKVDTLSKDNADAAAQIAAQAKKAAELTAQLEEQKKKAEEIQKKLDEQKKTPNNKNTSSGNKVDVDGKKKDDLSGFFQGPVGIIAVIVAILGALAAGYPMIAQMMPNLPKV